MKVEYKKADKEDKVSSVIWPLLIGLFGFMFILLLIGASTEIPDKATAQASKALVTPEPEFILLANKDTAWMRRDTLITISTTYFLKRK